MDGKPVKIIDNIILRSEEIILDFFIDFLVQFYK